MYKVNKIYPVRKSLKSNGSNFLFTKFCDKGYELRARFILFMFNRDHPSQRWRLHNRGFAELLPRRWLLL